MADRYYWQTDDPTVFLVGGKTFNIVKRGMEYAKQTGSITSWLGLHGTNALLKFQEIGREGEGAASEDTLTFLGRALSAALEPDAVIDLAAVLLGCDRAFAEEHFDIGWLLDALMVVWEKQPGIQFAVRRFANRFFGARPQVAQETSGTESSTASE